MSWSHAGMGGTGIMLQTVLAGGGGGGGGHLSVGGEEKGGWGIAVRFHVSTGLGTILLGVSGN